jgi:hypothetical protein
VGRAKAGCQNASKGRLKALYAPQIFPRLVKRAQFIVYFFAVNVFGLRIRKPERDNI